MSQADINTLFREILRDLEVVKYDFICCLVRATVVGTVQSVVRSEVQTSESMNITGFWGMWSRGLIYF